MLRFTVEVEIDDDRECEMVRTLGLRYPLLCRMVYQRIKDSMAECRIGVDLKGIHIGPMYDFQSGRLIENEAKEDFTKDKTFEFNRIRTHTQTF